MRGVVEEYGELVIGITKEIIDLICAESDLTIEHINANSRFRSPIQGKLYRLIRETIQRSKP